MVGLGTVNETKKHDDLIKEAVALLDGSGEKMNPKNGGNPKWEEPINGK